MECSVKIAASLILQKRPKYGAISLILKRRKNMIESFQCERLKEGINMQCILAFDLISNKLWETD